MAIPILIKAITSAQYPTPAERPVFSLLALGASAKIIEPIYWREQLDHCLNDIKKFSISLRLRFLLSFYNVNK